MSWHYGTFWHRSWFENLTMSGGDVIRSRPSDTYCI